MKEIYFLILFVALIRSHVVAQDIPTKLSDQATVSVLTVGPANPAYTMFGHTAIRLEDPLNRIDRVYNYGTFDFKAPGFFFKFLYGNLHLYLSASPFQ